VKRHVSGKRRRGTPRWLEKIPRAGFVFTVCLVTPAQLKSYLIIGGNDSRNASKCYHCERDAGPSAPCARRQKAGLRSTMGFSRGN
jgi:hypothetical protein